MNTSIKSLETERLILVPLNESHAPQVQEKFPKWEIVKYLLNKVPWPYPENGAIEYIRNIVLPNMKSGLEYYWAIFPKTSPNELIGIINLRKSDDENRGFWLDINWQNQGLMTEAAWVVTDFWFCELKMARMIVSKSIENHASSAISRKLGMRLVETSARNFVNGEMSAEIWELTRDEWLRNKGQN